MHKLVRHAWDNEAMVGIVTKTIRNAKSGVWTNDLLRFVIPEWVNSGIGLEISKPESMTADSKMTYFRITNMHGTESEFQLHSIDFAADAPEKFKGTRFSAAYLSEADQFEDKIVFDMLSDALRMPNVPYDQHMLIADCNPPDEGEDHWLHPLFFNPDQDTLDQFPDYFDDYVTLQFMLDDNPFISEKEKQDLRRRYSSDPNKKARYIDGLWVKDHSKSVFADVLLPNVHFIGDTTSPNTDEWECLVPAENCFEFLTGFDLGDVWHAAVIACPRLVGNTTVYDIIDELVYHKRRISIERFALEFLEKMDFWEDFMKEEYGKDKIRWRHWSDNSATRYRAAADSTEELIVKATTNNRILLNAVKKGAGTVGERKNLLRNMLFHNRIFIGSNLENVKSMLQEIKKGKTASQQIDPKSIHKHVFDALTYMLYSECPLDIERQGEPPVKSSPIISARL